MLNNVFKQENMTSIFHCLANRGLFILVIADVWFISLRIYALLKFSATRDTFLQHPGLDHVDKWKSLHAFIISSIIIMISCIYIIVTDYRIHQKQFEYQHIFRLQNLRSLFLKTIPS